MSLLSDAEIATMREDVQDTALVMMALIERAGAGTTDGYGQPVPGGFATLAAAVPCFYSAGRTTTSGENEGVVSHVDHPALVLLPANTDITERDRITVTDPDGDVFGPLDVTRVRHRMTGVEVLVDEVTS